MAFISPFHNDKQYEAAQPVQVIRKKPMPVSPNLSAVLIRNSIRSAAIPNSGVSLASVVGLVKANTLISYDNYAAHFEKERPGIYQVTFYLDGEPVDTYQAGTAAEAKLVVMEFLVNAAREDLAKNPIKIS